MTWANNLLTASFRGVPFDVQSVDGEADRALARHAYPYKDGNDIEDMGRRSRRFSFKAIFYGDDYEIRLQKFLAALDERGPGVLVHPVYGNIEKAQVCGYKDRHQAEDVDACIVAVEFEESIPSQPFFSRQLSGQKADAVGAAALAASAASGKVLADKFASLVGLGDTGALSALARINALRSQAVGFLTNLKAQVGGVISSISNPIRAAIGFVADVTALTQSIIDAVPNELEYLQNYAQSTLNKVDSLLSDPFAAWKASTSAPTYPVSTLQLKADSQILETHILTERAAVKSQVVGLVLASEADEPTMTPQQIESLTNNARESINDAIAAARARYGVEESRAITEPLKTLALTVQEAGRAVILARPPLVVRKVEAPVPLRLLAHHWYGDHTRSLELQRLNNLRLPNAINAGDSLNAYSK